MQAVSLGPLVFSIGVLAVLTGVAFANAAAGFLKTRGHADAGPALWWLLAVALVTARIAFVWRWWPGYREARWWAWLDIRDGGFTIWVGLLALGAGMLAWVWRHPALRRPLPFAVLAGVAAWGLVTLGAAQLRQAAHPPLPNLSLRQLDGSTFHLASLRGQPTVINLWATWCEPCRREMPELVQASHALPQVHFVFADQGESAATVRTFLAREGLEPAMVLLDAGSELAHQYNVPGFPTTLFVDADGRLQDMRIGALTRGSLHAHLERIVSLPPK